MTSVPHDQVLEFPDRTEYTRRGRFHRLDGPAIEFQDGSEEWYINGKRTRELPEGEPDAAVIRVILDNPILKQWWFKGQISRVVSQGPAIERMNVILERDSQGMIIDLVDKGVIQEWFFLGVRHNVGFPAYLVKTETDIIVHEQWWTNGKLNRGDDQPAIRRITNESINKEWLINRGQLTDPSDLPPWPPVPGAPLPDFERPDEFVDFEQNTVTIEEWWVDGVRHRQNGPALIITNSDGRVIRQECWVDGKLSGSIFKPDTSWVDVVETSQTTRVNVPIVMYETISSFVSALQTSLNSAISGKVFTVVYSNVTGLLTFTYTGEGDVKFRFSEDPEQSLSRNLGFPVDVSNEYSFVGNTLTSLLELTLDPLPAVKIFEGFDVDNKAIYSMEFWVEGLRERENGPAILQFVNTPPDANQRLERLFNYFWYENDQLHREDGPAIELSNGTQEWYFEGIRTRDDGPALIRFFANDKSGNPLFDEFWYLNDRLNRGNDLPAVTLHDGCQEWWVEGIRTRVGGPAIIKPNRRKIEDLFVEFDMDEDGFLSMDDFRVVYRSLGDEDLESIILYLDADEDGKVSLEEFLDVVSPGNSEYWYLEGELHRGTDEPAVIEYVETTLDPLLGPIYSFDYYWYTQGLLNRNEDRPAIENSRGDLLWYTDGLLNRAGDEPAIIRINGDREWWVNGVNTRDGQPAIIYGDGTEVWITDQPILTNLIITEPKDIPLTENLIRDLLPQTILISNIDNYSSQSVILNETVLRSIFSQYGTILKIDYQGTSASILYAFRTEAQESILAENDKVYGELAIGVTEAEDDVVVSLSKLGRDFTVVLINLSRIELSELVSRTIVEVGIGKRVQGRQILFTEPPRIEYPLSILEDLFSEVPDLVITKSERTFTIQFPESVTERFVYETYRDILFKNIQDLSTRVRTTQSGQSFRMDDPAIVTPVSQTWLVDGKIERPGEPAIVFSNGDRLWYEAGELHREDGPAVEKANGDKEWFLRGQRTRTDGPGNLRQINPAVELANGSEEWWIDGEQRRVDEYPIGAIIELPFFIASYPVNWLPCDGRDVARAEYPLLFDEIGITYGEGDGETTFTLPSLPDQGIKFENISVSDLPSRKVFVKFINQLHLWIKTFPFLKFKGALKRSIINNGKSIGQIVWETESYEEGLYYYVEQNNSFNHGTIRLLPPGEEPEDRIFTVTVSQEGRFRLEGLTLSGEPFVGTTPLIEVRRGDRLILDLNLRVPVYDFIWAIGGSPVRGGGLPAISRANGDQEWYINGTLNRAGDLPAIVRANGDQEWYINGILNRAGDLPAIVRANGDQEWYFNGFLHRTGFEPAIVKGDGTLLYYLCGRPVTLETYLEVLNQYDDFCILLP